MPLIGLLSAKDSLTKEHAQSTLKNIKNAIQRHQLASCIWQIPQDQSQLLKEFFEVIGLQPITTLLNSTADTNIIVDESKSVSEKLPIIIKNFSQLTAALQLLPQANIASRINFLIDGAFAKIIKNNEERQKILNLVFAGYPDYKNDIDTSKIPIRPELIKAAENGDLKSMLRLVSLKYPEFKAKIHELLKLSIEREFIDATRRGDLESIKLCIEYFAIAIAKNDIAVVRTYIDYGANLNAALLLLFREEHKSDTLYWLHEHPEHLQKLTVASLNTVISEGKYQGKTIAEILVSTKKGRQLVWENTSLQIVLSRTTIANTLPDYLNQAQTERNIVPTMEGFFKKPNPLAMQLVQYIVYGNLEKSEEILRANLNLLKTLLTEKVTVTDYSRRKVKKKTAFQAALCAMDDELCEMLAQYMTQEEMRNQYQELFPEGHERYYSAQTSFDFSQIVDTISQSSEKEQQLAFDLEFDNNTELWRNLEQFRSDFTQYSYQETVYNPQHLIKVFDLYDRQFGGWSRKQRDLFLRQVIGYVQRFLPANIAMDFAQGDLYDRAKNKALCRRLFTFKYGGRSIFPLDFDSFSGLGFEYCSLMGTRVYIWIHGRLGQPCISELLSSKNSNLERTYAARTEPQLSKLVYSSVR